VIAAGATALAGWCATCQLPTRVTVPVHAGTPGGPLLGTVELCPGCGANHATPMVTVTPARRGRFRFRHPVASVAAMAARHDSEARGLPAVECAYGDCPMPGSWDRTWRMQEDAGTTTWLFCKPAHRTAWLEESGLGRRVPRGR
jgi:hypothetical protein